MSRTCAGVLFVTLGWCVWGARALAEDDWLAVLPGCAFAAAALPELGLLYPRAGLPAVVAAGGVLVARVRVLAALTLPPGVQQEHVLSDWSAQLSGAGIVLGAAKLVHRHGLGLISVRPDGDASLVYRVRLQLAAYVAPGTYGFRLRTPFGELQADSAVRVLARGAVPRVARTSRALTPDAASLPVDVWLTAMEPALAASVDPPAAQRLQPVLQPGASAFALRVGAELWATGRCTEDAQDDGGFADEVLALAHAEGLELRGLQLTAASAGLAAERAGLPPSAAVLAGFDATSASTNMALWQASGQALRVDNRAGASKREFVVLLPAAAGLRARGGKLELFAASDLSVRRVAAVCALLHVPAGADALLELTATPAPRAVSLRAEPVKSGQLSVVRVIGAPEGARVAFDYGSGRTALRGAQLEASFSGPLGQPLRALVLPRDGGAQLLRRQLVVQPPRPPNCTIAQVQPASFAPTALLLGAWFLLKRRRR